MPYNVVFAPSGHAIRCTEDRSILQQALEAGLKLPFSCRSGVCRTCRGRVIAGRVDHGEVHPAYLSDDDRAKADAHLCQARARSDCTIRIDELDPAALFPTQQLPARVLAMTRLAPDVMAVLLGTPANEPIRFHAGQHIDVVLADGERRSYSIANAPDVNGVRQIELHIRHMPGGLFTDRVFGSLRARELIEIVVPQGQFRLRDDSDKPIVLVCSGTGFAPMKAMIVDALARGSKRPIHLYWGGRRRADLYLDAQARAWAATHPHIAYVPVLSDATRACDWAGRTGFVHRAVLEDSVALDDVEVYACGVPVMVEAARRDFTTLGHLPENAFFADSFVSAADRAPAPSIQKEAA